VRLTCCPEELRQLFENLHEGGGIYRQMILQVVLAYSLIYSFFFIFILRDFLPSQNTKARLGCSCLWQRIFHCVENAAILLLLKDYPKMRPFCIT